MPIVNIPRPPTGRPKAGIVDNTASAKKRTHVLARGSYENSERRPTGLFFNFVSSSGTIFLPYIVSKSKFRITSVRVSFKTVAGALENSVLYVQVPWITMNDQVIGFSTNTTFALTGIPVFTDGTRANVYNPQQVIQLSQRINTRFDYKIYDKDFAVMDDAKFDSVQMTLEAVEEAVEA